MHYYFSEKNMEVCSFDGSVKLEERRRQIQEFNDVDSDYRIYFLSTRAVVWELISLLLILAFYTIVTRIHKWIYRQWTGVIEMAKQSLFMSCLQACNQPAHTNSFMYLWNLVLMFFMFYVNSRICIKNILVLY